MKLLILLTADYAQIEGATGKLYVLGAFNRIYAAQLPTRHARMALVARISSEVSDSTGELILSSMLVDADGQEILKFEAPFSMSISRDGSRPYYDLVVEIGGILFPHAGTYEFKVSVGDEILGSTPIDIIDSRQ